MESMNKQIIIHKVQLIESKQIIQFEFLDTSSPSDQWINKFQY